MKSLKKTRRIQVIAVAVVALVVSTGLIGYAMSNSDGGFLANLGLGGVGILSFVMTTALNALEFLVAGLQAYIFAILTCVYLNDALHPSH